MIPGKRQYCDNVFVIAGLGNPIGNRSPNGAVRGFVCIRVVDEYP